MINNNCIRIQGGDLYCIYDSMQLQKNTFKRLFIVQNSLNNKLPDLISLFFMQNMEVWDLTLATVLPWLKSWATSTVEASPWPSVSSLTWPLQHWPGRIFETSDPTVLIAALKYEQTLQDATGWATARFLFHIIYCDSRRLLQNKRECVNTLCTEFRCPSSAQ